jgi:putative membrane protein
MGLMIFGTIFWLVLLILVVLAGVWLVRNLGSGAPRGHAQDAEGVLRRRYAAGEIDEDEYCRRLSTLREHNKPKAL